MHANSLKDTQQEKESAPHEEVSTPFLNCGVRDTDKGLLKSTCIKANKDCGKANYKDEKWTTPPFDLQTSTSFWGCSKDL
jgi:hypothetical protein